ncbi:MAG: DUF433 domain-containing protein [Chloroflexi bacterium]|nr:DUF433 domain-containing protein [Chloroflexota bacterium]
MTLLTKSTRVPLVKDGEGVLRVGRTRVTLDTLINAFDHGATAEEIVQQYSTLELADVYAVISYYLQKRAEVENYLGRRKKQREEIRRRNEVRYDPHGIRDRLLARRNKK